jgi:arginine decarboxylase
MLSQERAPLLEALQLTLKGGRAPFHVPAHLGRPLPGFQGLQVEGLFAMDLTELPGLDDLHCPTGPLLQAQELAAACFGSACTFFLVNGVTAGILAAHLYYGGPGKKVLLPRESHRSHYSGIMLAGSTPVYLASRWQEGIPLNLEAAALEEALVEHPDTAAVFVTSPGYHGACADLAKLRDMTGRRGIPLVVDEAHGTHLSFSPRLPRGAAEAGADLWAQSTHKSGGALTQGGMLHGGQGVDPGRLRFLLGLLETSSPSFPIMASLDEARRFLALHGQERAEAAAALAGDLRRELLPLTSFRVFRMAGFAADPLKLALMTDRPGPRALEDLRRAGVEPELAGFSHVLFLLSLFHGPAETRFLRDVLVRLDGERGPGVRPPLPAPPPLPRQVLPPGRALTLPSRALPLKQAGGRVAAELVVPSPPGIPILVPGEEIGPELLDFLREIRDLSLPCQLADPSLNTLKVLEK